MGDYRELVSPGGAFSEGFNEVLYKQAALRRQAMLDQITQQREARLAEADRLDNEIRRAQLQRQIAEDKDREANNFITRYQKTAVKGDIPSADTLKHAHDLGVADIFQEDMSKHVAPPPSQSMELPGAVMPGGPPPPSGDNIMPPAGVRLVPPPGSAPPPEAPAAPVPHAALGPGPSEAGLKGPTAYIGDAKDREFEQMKMAAANVMKGLAPDSPERKELEFFFATGGKTLPAGIFAGQKPPAVGTLGYELWRASGGHPENLTAEQAGEIRKKWGDEGRGPMPPIIIQGDTLRGPMIVDRGTSSARPITDRKTGDPLGPKESATTADRRSRAQDVSASFPRVEQEIQQAADMGLLGPLAGRTMSEFLLGAVGSTGDPVKDDLLAALKMDLSLASSGTASLHGRGGANVGVARDIQAMLNQNKMDKAGLEGAMKSLRHWVDVYAGSEPSGAGAPGAPTVIPPGVTVTKRK